MLSIEMEGQGVFDCWWALFGTARECFKKRGSQRPCLVRRVVWAKDASATACFRFLVNFALCPTLERLYTLIKRPSRLPEDRRSTYIPITQWQRLLYLGV
jgi:hypothetical protein